MKRIALILSLTGTTAFAEITPYDVIESWRTVYAGTGATITYEEATQGPEGKALVLHNVTSVEMLVDDVTTSHFDWVKLQQLANGNIQITFSAQGNRDKVTTTSNDPGMMSSEVFDFSKLSLLATGYPGDIRYTYEAPSITYTETTGDDDYGTRLDLSIYEITGEATSITNITESGPRVADFGTFNFTRIEVEKNEHAFYGSPVITQLSAQNIGATFRTEFPLAAIPDSPVAMPDFPPGMIMEMGLSSAALSGTQEEDVTSFGPRIVSFGHDGGTVSLRAAQNNIRSDFSSHGGRLKIEDPSPGGPNFELALGEVQANLSMPFRRADAPKPFSAALTLGRVALSEGNWADVDPDNAMGRPTADLAISVSGLIHMLAGVFESTSELETPDRKFFISDLSLDTFRIATGGATIEGEGEVQFNRNRTDPDTTLPAMKGALDFSIIGALGFLDRFGRLPGVDPMAILGAKGGLGMFTSPTDTPDSFSSKVEFLNDGGIMVNGQQVR